MITSIDENIFRVVGSLWKKTTHQWISPIKANDAELWCFFVFVFLCEPEQTVKQTVELATVQLWLFMHACHANPNIRSSEAPDLTLQNIDYFYSCTCICGQNSRIPISHRTCSWFDLALFLFFCCIIICHEMSSNGNIFRITGHLCGEFTGPRWFPHTKASDADIWCFLWSAPE